VRGNQAPLPRAALPPGARSRCAGPALDSPPWLCQSRAPVRPPLSQPAPPPVNPACGEGLGTRLNPQLPAGPSPAPAPWGPGLPPTHPPSFSTGGVCSEPARQPQPTKPPGGGASAPPATPPNAAVCFLTNSRLCSRAPLPSLRPYGAPSHTARTANERASLGRFSSAGVGGAAPDWLERDDRWTAGNGGVFGFSNRQGGREREPV
jgi:hypothetical protein